MYVFRKHCSYHLTFLTAVFMLTTTAISVDRLLALLFGLKYRHVVTLKRVGTFVLYFWIAFNFDDGSKILRYLKIYGYAFSELVTPGLLLLENCVRSSTSSSFITKCPSRTRMRRNSTEHLRIVFCWLKLMLSPGQYSFCYSYNQQVLHLYPCTGYLQQLLFV